MAEYKFDKLLKDLKKINTELDKTVQKANTVHEGIKKLGTGGKLENYTSAVKTLNSENTKLIQSEKQYNEALKKSEKLQRQAAKEALKYNEAEQKRLATERVLAQEIRKRATEEAKLKREMRELEILQRKKIKSDKEMMRYETLLVKKKQNLRVETKKQAKEYNNLTKQIIKVNNANRKQNESIGRFQGSVGKYSNAIKGLAANFGILGGAMLAVTLIRNTFNTFVEFEQNIDKLGAISGATTEQLKLLSDQAKELGAVTAFTARDIVRLDIELAKLGFTAEQIENAVPGIQSLATATGTDLAEAASLAGSALNIFGLDASEAQRVSDVLSLSTATSALNMNKLADSLPYVGTSAKVAGKDIEWTTSRLAVLVDRGMKSTTAGTGLRKIFAELAKKGLDYNKSLEKINNSSDKSKTAIELFGIKAANAAIILAENVEQANELEIAYRNAGGSAKKMSKQMLDNIGGDVTLLKSAWEGFILSVEDGTGILGKAIRGLIQGITFLIKNLKIIIPIIAAYFAGMKAAALSTLLFTKANEKLTFSFKTLFKTLKLNPFGLILAAVTALVLIIPKLIKNTKQLTSAQKANNEVSKAVNKQIQSEKTNLELLLRVAKDEKRSKEERLRAIEKINKISPEFLGNITLEEINTDKTTAAIDRYIKKLEEQTRARVGQSKITEIDKKIFEIEIRQQEEMRKIKEVFPIDNLSSLQQEALDRAVKNINKGYEKELNAVKKFKDDYLDILDKLDVNLIGGEMGGGGGGGGNISDSTSKKPIPTHGSEATILGAKGRMIAATGMTPLTVAEADALFNKSVDAIVTAGKTAKKNLFERLKDKDDNRSFLAKVLNISDKDAAAVAAAVNEAFNQAMQLMSNYLAQKRQAIDEEISMIDDKMQKSQEDLKAEEEKIQKLIEAGAAYDLTKKESLEKRLAGEQKAKEKALKEEKKIKEQQKKMDIVSANIAIATSILNASKLEPTWVAIVMSAVMGALGAVQLAQIKSAKYAKGTEYVEQGNNRSGVDTVPAMVTIGERIVETDVNKKMPKGFKNEWLPDAAKLWLSGGYSNYYVNDNGKVIEKLDVIADNTSRDIIRDMNGNITFEKKGNHFISYS